MNSKELMAAVREMNDFLKLPLPVVDGFIEMAEEMYSEELYPGFITKLFREVYVGCYGSWQQIAREVEDSAFYAATEDMTQEEVNGLPEDVVREIFMVEREVGSVTSFEVGGKIYLFSWS